MEQYRPGGFKMLPDVVKNILIINVLLFLATMAAINVMKVDLIDMLGLHYFGAEKFRPYQFISYMFMHGGFMHIFFNMFALWMFGSVLENYWGPKKFLIYYFVTGIGAALVHYAIMYYQISPVIEMLNNYTAAPSVEKFNEIAKSGIFGASGDIINLYNQFSASLAKANDAEALRLSADFIENVKVAYLNAPNVVGASGAVFGLLLAFGMMFPNASLYLMFIPIPIKAKYFVIIYGAIELWSGISNRAGDNVAHFAHLGGMLFGIFLILLWKKKRSI
jgi:membrane associated rhomboid family serine protease